MQQVETKVLGLEKQEKRNSDQILHLQRELKKNNLIIFGLEEEEEEDLLSKIIDLFNTTLKLKVTESDINNVFRFGRKNKSRPILVKFITCYKKTAVLKQGSLLKTTQISISNDLIKEDREKQKVLREHLKTARGAYPDAKIVKNQLLVNNKYYTVNELIAISNQNTIQENEPLNKVLKTNAVSTANYQLQNPESPTRNPEISLTSVPAAVTIRSDRQDPPKQHQPNFSTYITRARKAEFNQGTKK